MEKWICDKVEEVLKERFKHNISVENHDYYIWVYSMDKHNSSRIMIIHGYGDDYEPFEIICPKGIKGVDTFVKRFKDEEKLFNYIKTDFFDELVLMNI